MQASFDKNLSSAFERFKNGQVSSDDLDLIAQAVALGQIKIVPSGDSKTILQSGGVNYGESNEIHISGPVIGSLNISEISSDQVEQILQRLENQLSEKASPVQNKPEQNEEHKRINWTPYIVAIFGLLGALAIAYATLVAPRLATQEAIRATQSKEATLTSDAALALRSITLASPSSAVPENSTLVSTATFTVPPDQTEISLESIMNVNESWGFCGASYQIPENFLTGSPEEILARFNQRMKQSKFPSSEWLLLHDNVNLTLLLTNLQGVDGPWIRIDNTVKVIVNRYDLLPHVNIASIEGLNFACGGGGVTREFPTIELNSNITNVMEYTEVDFFTLQPGEFEEFYLNVECGEPGIYEFSFEVDVFYAGKKDKIQIASPMKLHCGQTYSTWAFVLDNDGEYKAIGWPGSKVLYVNPWQPCENREFTALYESYNYDYYIDPVLDRRVNLYRNPGLDQPIIDFIKPGEMIDNIFEPPVCKDGLVWWQISNPHAPNSWPIDETPSNLYGWISEGDSESKWLLPCYLSVYCVGKSSDNN